MGMVLHVKEGLDCMELTVGDNIVKSLWLRMKAKANETDVMGVYYRSVSQDDDTDE